MLNVGTPELLVILLVALLVLGPTKLPEAARQLGRAAAELRRMSSGFQAELRDALHEPVEGTPPSAHGSHHAPPSSPAADVAGAGEPADDGPGAASTDPGGNGSAGS